METELVLVERNIGVVRRKQRTICWGLIENIQFRAEYK